jgi:hypothetical protein
MTALGKPLLIVSAPLLSVIFRLFLNTLQQSMISNTAGALVPPKKLLSKKLLVKLYWHYFQKIEVN